MQKTIEDIKIELTQPVPSKKNLYKIGRGRFYPDKSVNEFVNASFLEIKHQLGKIETIESPVALDICFMMDDRGDLDNKISMIFDLLQEVKLIGNDRQIRRVNARREKTKKKNSKTFINIVVLENGKG